jgi:aspartate beta-hydroxylase
MADSTDVEDRLVSALQREFGLSPFSLTMCRAWLERTFADEDMTHVRQFLLNIVNSRRLPKDSSPWQHRCPELIPGLTSKPVWQPEDHPRLAWVRSLEASWEAIRDEALGLRERGSDGVKVLGFQPYRAPKWADAAAAGSDAVPAAHEGGSWNVCYLKLHGVVDTSSALTKCPRTSELLDGLPRGYDHAMFSALAPGTHVKPHCGPTNKKLRVHFPLHVPAGTSMCRLRAGDQVVEQVEGRALIFDDSFEHEAWNDHPAEARLVLIVDVWHPELSDQEVKFLSFLRAAQLRQARALSAAGTVKGEDDFVALLSASKSVTVAAEHVFPHDPEAGEGGVS